MNMEDWVGVGILLVVVVNFYVLSGAWQAASEAKRTYLRSQWSLGRLRSQVLQFRSASMLGTGVAQALLREINSTLEETNR